MEDIKEIMKCTSKINLLYVEDDKSAMEASSSLLENFFSNITTAVDGRDGLEKFKNSKIDLIITDINMPYLNGLEMIDEIKKIDKDIKVIIFSANIEPKYFTESIRLGVNGYLLKPIDIEQLINLLKNIVSSMRLRDEIEKNTKRLQTVVDASYDPIMVIKKDYTIDFMSKSIKDNIHKLDIADRDNPKCYEVSYHRDSPCEGENHRCPLKDVIESKKATTVVHKHKDGRYIEIGATPLIDEDDRCVGIVEISRDITKHITAKERLERQKDILEHKAHHDKLTGLPNKSLFEERFREAIVEADIDGTKFALFFIDLNKFKWVNDNLGHDIGDLVLINVAKVVGRDIRKEDTFARIGGDEFTIIMRGINQKDEAMALAQKVLNSIEQPMVCMGHDIDISASIGVVIYPDDSKDEVELLKCADVAMYSAKGSSDNIKYYSKEI